MNRSADGWSRLTRAERGVVDLACEGLTNPEIARRLSISPRTVQRHLYEIFRKVQVSTRTQLVAEAVRRDLDRRRAQAPAQPDEGAEVEPRGP